MQSPHPRPSSSSTLTFPSSVNGKKGFRGKERQFVYKHGSKLHAYDRDKAPYPLSFDKHALGLQCLDHTYGIASSESPSGAWTDFKGDPPKRCLDLATGLGLWVVASAEAWPDSTFVGYDLVDIQPPLCFLDPSIAERVEWVHGNLLRKQLPFEDDEFDHVRITGLALGIPENKWVSIFEEIRRVMRPGATIEMIEEDARFPVLPRWFTAPLRKQSHKPTIHLPDGTQKPPAVEIPEAPTTSHDHELLESLFYDVFENRFINPTPSSCLPSYFTMIFDHVVVPPTITVPMPPLPPFPPLPEANCGPNSFIPGQIPESSFHLPPVTVDTSVSVSLPSTPTPVGPKPSSSFPSPRASERNGTPSTDRDRSLSMTSTVSTVSTSSSCSSNAPSTLSDTSSAAPRSTISVSTSINSTAVGSAGTSVVLPTRSMGVHSESSLYLHLQRAVGLVFAVKEAMWEELTVLIAQRDEKLRKYGWETDDYCEILSRQKFEALMEQFESDIRVRISMWHSLVENGWEYPRREVVSKGELIEEIRLREEIIEARRKYTQDQDEDERPCRTIRLLLGVKES